MYPSQNLQKHLDLLVVEEVEIGEPFYNLWIGSTACARDGIPA